MEKEAEKYETEKKNIERKMLIRLTGVAAIVLLLVLGLSRAWFVSRNNIGTLVQVAEPSKISLRGPHGEALTELDMSYTDKDKTGDKVTIRRVVSVSSDAEQHKLEIVHTTNMKDLTFQVYPATEVTSETADITEDNYKYTYKGNNAVPGRYINQAENSNTSYKYATQDKHTNNFEDGDTVQSHAEPIYWLSDVQNGKQRDKNTTTTVNTEYLNYYVIEISWTEATKETGMFYVLVKNA